MRTIGLIIFLFSTFLFSSLSYARVPYDTFSDPLMDRAKWRWWERGVQLIDDKLELTHRSPNEGMQSISIANPESINSLSAVVNFKTHPLSLADNTDAMAGLGGTFYRSNGKDVFVALALEYNGDTSTADTVEISAVINYWDGNTFENYDDTEFTIKTAPGEEVKLLLIYEGGTSFTFEAGPPVTSGVWNGEEIVTLTGPLPDTPSSPEKPIKLLFTTAEAESEANEVLTTATFDDVWTNGMSYDNFNNPRFPGEPNIYINDLNWIQRDFFSSNWTSRKIADDALEITVQNIGQSSIREIIDIPEENRTNYFQADLTIAPSSFHSGINDISPGGSSSDRFEVRLDAFKFNALRDGSTEKPYDEATGESWVMIRSEMFGDRDPTVAAIIGYCGDATCSSENEVELFYGKLPCTVTAGVANTLSIEKKEKILLFSCDGSTVSYEHDGEMFPSGNGDMHRVSARIRSQPDQHGFLSAIVDNVYTTAAPTSSWNLFLPPILNSSRDTK